MGIMDEPVRMNNIRSMGGIYITELCNTIPLYILECRLKRLIRDYPEIYTIIYDFQKKYRYRKDCNPQECLQIILENIETMTEAEIKYALSFLEKKNNIIKSLKKILKRR